MKHIFIIGSKGIPCTYGGFETFVDKLTEYHQHTSDLKYHVACKGNTNEESEYHNAHCFQLKVPKIGATQAVYYDLAAMKYCCDYIEGHEIYDAIIYILACRIGPFLSYFKKQLRRFRTQIFVNPDGHEWLRAKWPWIIKKYWKLSEGFMVKHADYMICDSQAIERYICKEYAKYAPRTTFIAYGAEMRRSKLSDTDALLRQWYQRFGLEEKEYYLIVGRFVPENNYETMLREYQKCHSKKKLVIITQKDEKMLLDMQKKTKFESDDRIIFAGTVYNKELLMKIREKAFGYFHGHEVGGTNPSLLEALGSTDLNYILDVEFNREVAEDGGIFWTKENGSLSNLIDQIECLPEEMMQRYSQKAKKRISVYYNWQRIADQYHKVFTDGI